MATQYHCWVMQGKKEPDNPILIPCEELEDYVDENDLELIEGMAVGDKHVDADGDVWERIE